MPKYTKTSWVDKLVQFPSRYKDQNNNQLTLTADPGTVTQAGTPFSAGNMNKIETALEDANNEKAAVSTTIKHGLNAVDIPQSGPFNVVIGGKTLVNPLGTDGNCESLTPWTIVGTVALSTTQKKNGTNSLKATASAADAYAYKDYTYPLDTTKQYFVGAWIYIESYTSGTVSVSLRDVGTLTSRYSASANTATVGSWQFVYVKVPTANVLVGSGFRVLAGVTGAGTAVVYIDDIRLYELDATTYSAIGTTYTATTNPSIADILPYVDSIKPLQGVGVVRYGKNLLPPFTDSAWTLHANAVATSAYTLTLNATAANQDSTVDIAVLPSTTYTLSIGSMPVGRIDIDANNAAGAFSFKTGFNGPTTSVTFTTNSDSTKIRLYFKGLTSGTFTFTNPQLELGTSATEFAQRNDDYLFAVSDSKGNPLQLWSSIDGSVKDELRIRDGQAVKFKRWETDNVIDGSLAWAYNASGTGYKRIVITSYFSATPPDSYLLKYNGAPLKKGAVIGDLVSADMYLATTNLYITVNNSDSGWIDAVNPSPNAVKALMNGWKANANDGTNYTSWVSILDGSSPATNNVAYVSANKAPNWKGWATLAYQLATSKEETVTVEGSLSVFQGLNQVEVLEGVVVREKVTPVQSPTNLSYYINAYQNSNSSLTGLNSKAKYKVQKFFGIYKGNSIDKNWGTSGAESTNGNGALVSCLPANFDATAEYFATYFASDKYLITVNAPDITASYRSNVGSVILEHTKEIADNRTWLSAIKIFVDWISSKLTSHINTTTSVHGSTTASTANTLAQRDASGNLTAKQIISDVPSGTPPISVVSPTLVPSLNADRVDGLHFRINNGALEYDSGGGFTPVSGVYNVLRGTTNFAGADMSIDVTIAPTKALNKLQITHFSFKVDTNSADTQDQIADETNFLAQLTSATNLRIQRTSSSGNATAVISWEITENL